MIATSGKYRAESEVWLEVRTPNVAQTRFERATRRAGRELELHAQGLRAGGHAGGDARGVGAAAA